METNMLIRTNLEKFGGACYRISFCGMTLTLTNHEYRELYKTITAFHQTLRETWRRNAQRDYIKHREQRNAQGKIYREKNSEKIHAHDQQRYKERCAREKMLKEKGLKLLIHNVNKKHKEIQNDKRNFDAPPIETLCQSGVTLCTDK